MKKWKEYCATYVLTMVVAGCSSRTPTADHSDAGVSIRDSQADFLTPGDAGTTKDQRTNPDRGKTIQQHRLSFSAGGSGDDIVTSIAVSANGDIVIAGRFYETTNLGGGALTSRGFSDAFIARYDAKGKHLWSHAFGGDGQDEIGRVVMTTAGHIVALGSTNRSSEDGKSDFGGGPLPHAGGADVVVAQYNAGGDHMWSRSIGGPQWDSAGAIAVEDNGMVVVAGSYEDQADIGGTRHTSKEGADAFILRLDKSGAPLMSKTFGGTGQDGIQDLTIGPNGIIIVAGNFEETLELQGTITSRGSRDIFLAAFDTKGTLQWSKHFGDKEWDHAAAVFYRDASITLVGRYRRKANFGGKEFVTFGEDVFLATFDLSGKHQASATWGVESPPGFFGETLPEVPTACALAQDGTVFLVSPFSGKPNFPEADPSRAKGDTDGLAVQLDPRSGTLVWHLRTQGEQKDGIVAVASDAKGGVVLAGEFEGTLALGGGSFTSAGKRDLFIAHFTP